MMNSPPNQVPSFSRHTARSFRIRGSGPIRTMVVASATLAILLVCFSIYQYSQKEDDSEAFHRSRLPATPSTTLDRSAPPDDPHAPSVNVGPATIGPGRQVKLTFYSQEGTKARFEIMVSSWTPISGTVNDLMLVEPEIRMRTNAGNALRVTAQKGILEVRRKAGGGLDPVRGQLIGDVSIEIDRLTEQERLARSTSAPSTIDPSELVHVRVSEIAFDLEYSKLSIPGEVRLTARDVDFTANVVDARFDAQAGRLESLQISEGGRIELRDLAGTLGLSEEESAPKNLSVVDWIRETLRSGLDSGTPTDSQ
ncbi:MAG: hypothetical protein AABZ47_05335, partial [Planctomycetota bacterium]